MTPTDPLDAAWEDMLSELRFGDDTEVAYVEEVVAKHRPLIEAATPRPAGVEPPAEAYERGVREGIRFERERIQKVAPEFAAAALTGTEEPARE